MTEHITVSRELLRQALDALEWCEPSGLTGPHGIASRKAAITALRTALEQETSPSDEYLSQPAVEPVGWYWEYNGLPDGQVFFGKGPDADVIKRGLSAEFPRVVRYVYAAPQAPSLSSGWLRAIDEELVSTHLGVANASDSYEDAKRKLNSLICWHIDVAIDPKVNGNEPIAWGRPHEHEGIDMVFLSKEECEQYLDDDEEAIPLYAVNLKP